MRTSFLFMSSSPLKVYFYVCLMMYIKLGRQRLFIIINRRSPGCVLSPVRGPSIFVGRAVSAPCPPPLTGRGPLPQKGGPLAAAWETWESDGGKEIASPTPLQGLAVPRTSPPWDSPLPMPLMV